MALPVSNPQWPKSCQAREWLTQIVRCLYISRTTLCALAICSAETLGDTFAAALIHFAGVRDALEFGIAVESLVALLRMQATTVFRSLQQTTLALNFALFY